MPPIPTDQLLACATEAARAGGLHALHNRARRHDAVSATKHDIKLHLDMECQGIIFDSIRKAFPAHRILGEEEIRRSDAHGESEYCWIVDPIDGTINFSHGMDIWCSSVAVQQGDTILAGAVFAPALDELYTATHDGPALFNGDPIAVSPTTELANSVVRTGFDKCEEPPLPQLALLQRITAAVRRPRILGSAALDICNVAKGTADGYFETGIYIWDAAAAGLICERAGGKTETVRKFADYRRAVLATNGHIHSALRDVIGM